MEAQVGSAHAPSVQAPCRIAMQTKTRCPKCQRPVSIKTLKYTHTCGRTWDVEERVREEERKAHAKHAKHAKSKKSQQTTPPATSP